MRKKEVSLSNTKIAVVFFIFLAFVIGISIIFKAAEVIRAGRFDDSRRFTLTLTNEKKTEVISLSPEQKEITIFKLNGGIKPAEAGRFLKIPVDGFIAQNSLDLDQKVDSLFMKTILNWNRLKTNLTVIDLLKLAMLSRTVPENLVNVKMIGDASGTELDKIVSRFVIDVDIEKEQQTIRIINGTEIAGLGNRLARLVTNMGGNVIIVATSNVPIRKSTISYIDQKTYTVERLQKVLGYEAVRGGGGAISDVTITIGEDGVTNNF